MNWMDMIFPLVMVTLFFIGVVDVLFIMWDRTAYRLREQQWIREIVNDASDLVCDELEHDASQYDPSSKTVKNWLFDAAKRSKHLSWWVRLDDRSKDKIADMALLMGHEKLDRKRAETYRAEEEARDYTQPVMASAGARGECAARVW